MNSEVATERRESTRSSAADDPTEEPETDRKGDATGGVPVLNEAPEDGGYAAFDKVDHFSGSGDKGRDRGLSRFAGLKAKYGNLKDSTNVLMAAAFGEAGGVEPIDGGLGDTERCGVVCLGVTARNGDA
mmetsp:Transcript_144383/g.251692  ORF Transcript_144383/g.251692 Transcript_144383/m.251692 type:complete len:129 (+) Transcript_144383:736-1122(+)